MTARTIGVVGLFWALPMLLPATGWAIATQLSGTFTLAGGQATTVENAIETAIAPMSFIARPFARSRLHQIAVPYPQLVIDATADEIVVIADARVPIRTPWSGAPIRWQREDGEPFTVTGKWDGSVFEQRFASGTGRRVNRYSLSGDRRILTIDVAIYGGGLPGTMNYQLVYERVGLQTAN